jgi:hypothetical protein
MHYLESDLPWWRGLVDDPVLSTKLTRRRAYNTINTVLAIVFIIPNEFRILPITQSGHVDILLQSDINDAINSAVM